MPEQLTILVIEDDPKLLEWWLYALPMVENNFQVYGAGSLAGLVRRFPVIQPDCIIIEEHIAEQANSTWLTSLAPLSSSGIPVILLSETPPIPRTHLQQAFGPVLCWCMKPALPFELGQSILQQTSQSARRSM